MSIDVVFAANAIQDVQPALACQFERAVADVLDRAPSIEKKRLTVRFSVWDGDAVRYVCKVEEPIAAEIEAAAPPWRWWSGLVATPQELAAQLGEALDARRSPGKARVSAPTPPERSGWGELQLI